MTKRPVAPRVIGRTCDGRRRQAPAQHVARGLLRLRATVTQRSSIGETLLAQRSFVARQVATTPDAAGGVRALAAATDQVIGEIEVWLGQVAPAGKAP